MNLLAMKRSMEQIDSPLITVVTVVFNDVQHIEETILSVVNQTYPNIEYIIIDGGSTDGTVDIIKKYEERIAYWVSEPDKGIYDAMNKGIQKATGEWINFMNAGDVFALNNTISSLFIGMDYQCDVLYGDTVHILTSGRYLHRAEPIYILEHRMPFCHQSCFVKANLLKNIGFNCKYRIAADYDLFYRLYKQGYVFQQVSNTIAVFESIEGLSSVHPELLYREYSEINGKSFQILRIKVKVRNLLKRLMKIFPEGCQHRLSQGYKRIFTAYKKLD